MTLDRSYSIQEIISIIDNPLAKVIGDTSIKATKNYVNEYWFENLNLRGSYKKIILDYIKSNYPGIFNEYEKIYLFSDKQYWIDLSFEIEAYCKQNTIKYLNYFYHDELVKNKRKS